jgi:hypothetical protein
MSKLIIYELVKVTPDGKKKAITQDMDQAQIYGLQAIMNRQAPDGVLYEVRKVEAVTRPFRVVES